jgi:hypothetical protein
MGREINSQLEPQICLIRMGTGDILLFRSNQVIFPDIFHMEFKQKVEQFAADVAGCFDMVLGSCRL